MLDLSQVDRAKLPPTSDDETNAKANEYDNKKQQQQHLFLDNWPAPPKFNEDQMDELMSNEVRKWRLQSVLAVQPFGVPSLALGQIYENMYGIKFDLRDFGCANLFPDLVDKMSDILVVQQPDETTPVLFPEYPNDRILHDIRLGHDFSKLNFDRGELCSDKYGDHNDLIFRAWLARDDDFPDDVALLGDSYEELCKIAQAMVPGSRGLYRATLISTAGPDSLFIRLKTNDEISERVRGLSNEIECYFQETKLSVEAYSVPEEFITHNFPCLFHSPLDNTWSRCIIVGRSKRDKQKILVESIDFGGIYALHKIYLFLIPRKFLNIPRLTLEVALPCLKPSRNAKLWSKRVGARLRCFSISDYHLEVLLMEPKRVATTQISALPETSTDTVSSIANEPVESLSQGETQQLPASVLVEADNGKDTTSSYKKKKLLNRVIHEAIVIDRNDDDMDVYLDELLTLETYAERIEDKSYEDLVTLKNQLHRALSRIPRPTNPLGQLEVNSYVKKS